MYAVFNFLSSLCLGKTEYKAAMQCMTKGYKRHKKCWRCKCREHSGAQGNHHTVHDFWLNVAKFCSMDDADTEDLLHTEDCFSCFRLCCAAPQFHSKWLIVLPMPAKLDLELRHGSCRTAWDAKWRRSPQKLWREASEQPLCHCLLFTYICAIMYVSVYIYVLRFEI